MAYQVEAGSMTLEEFSRDFVPLLNLIVVTVGLASLIFLWRQIKVAIDWNKLNASRDYYKDLPSDAEEKEIQRSLRGMGIDPYSRISIEKVNEIFADFEIFTAVKLYLNKYEVFCTAVGAGIVDEILARDLAGDKVVILINVFRHLIDRQRQELNLDVIWIEIEKFGSKWEMHRKQRMIENLQEMKEIEVALN